MVFDKCVASWGDVAGFRTNLTDGPIGCSSRHAAHQEAQVFSSQTWPNMSFTENCRSGACRCGAINMGAGLPIKGDGISRGSLVRPIAKNTASTTKSASGMNAFFTSYLSWSISFTHFRFTNASNSLNDGFSVENKTCLPNSMEVDGL